MDDRPTQAEAIAACAVLRRRCRQIDTAITAVGRKRLWTNAEKTRHRVDLRQEQDAIATALRVLTPLSEHRF